MGVDLHACLLKRQAAPAKSVLERDRNWTYAEFVSHAQQAAEYFRDNRIERVLIHLPQGFNAYVLIWAAYLAGTAFCTVGDNTPPIRRQRYLEAFQPDLVISEEQFGASTTPSALFDRTACCTSGPMDMASYLDPDATAYVLFTSGSTGRPKGVMISRRSLEFVVAFALREYAVDENDVWAQYSSIGFDLSVLDVFTAIAAGAAVVPIVSQGDRLMPARLIALHSITIWHSVPSAFELLDHSRRLTAETLAPLRLIIFCGEPLYPTLIAKIFTAKSDL
ncbi:MAG TPA: AMP-binding protein, partial [Sphingopyxis sp.]|nr:AMP-binding protein [Sphingopyxis sp.]